jgi:hypothetical protein
MTSTRSQREERRLKKLESKRKQREDFSFRIREASLARERYRRKKQQIQSLQEQLFFLKELIITKQKKSMNYNFDFLKLKRLSI